MSNINKAIRMIRHFRSLSWLQLLLPWLQLIAEVLGHKEVFNFLKGKKKAGSCGGGHPKLPCVQGFQLQAETRGDFRGNRGGLAVSNAILFLLLTLPAVAQTPVLTLDSVLAEVERSNPGLQQYDARARAMEQYAEGSTAWMPPMVGGGVFMFPYNLQTGEPGMMPSSYMLSVEQQIPNPAKQRARRDYYASRSAVEAAARAEAFNDLRTQAKEAYYRWVVLAQKQQVLEENERIIAFMLKVARLRYPYNQGPLAGIYEAEARQQQIQNEQLMLASDIAKQRVMLSTLMNQSGTPAFSIDTTLQLPEPVQVGLDSTDLSAVRSDVQRINRSIQTMQLNLAREGLERKPDFRLSFNHMTPRGFDRPSMFTAMAMVSIPIAPWSAGGYQSNVRAMNSEVIALRRERENLLNEARGRLHSLALELNAKRQQVENYRDKILPALQKNYDVTLLAYEENQSELPPLIDAWEALNSMQLDYLDQLEQLYLLRIRYEQELER